MTDHARALEQLAYYRDLDPAERRAVDAHLAGCAECRATHAAYARQDKALAAIPEQRARGAQPRPWRAPAPPLARRWLGRLGDGLVIAGVCALLWMFALQVQYLGQAVADGTAGTPAAARTEPGLTLPPTSLRPPSPWLPALPYIGGSLLLVGGLFVFSRHSRWPPVAGGAVAALFLVSAVPPLSVLPNPVGLYWRLAGGYSYDPHLPFRNQFVMSGQPDAILRPHLDRLIGEVGLSPLDPVQPLARYDILRVGLHPRHKNVALVTTRFTYADGSSRIYPVPLLEPALTWDGFWLGGWREDGLQRLRSDHLALPGQPFATAASPVQVGPARSLALPPTANRLDEVNPGHWLWTSTRVQRLAWSPDGTQFLAAMELDPGRRQLWVIALNGSQPRLLATGDVVEYGWAPDGQAVVYTHVDAAAAEVNPARPYAVRVTVLASGQGLTLVTGLASGQLPGLTGSGAWFFLDDALWVAPYDGGEARLLAGDLGEHDPTEAPRPSPDETRAIFGCGGATCLLTLDGAAAPAVTALSGFHQANAAWTADNRRVAVVDINRSFVSPVGLVVLDRDGETQLDVDIAPREATEPPQWTPDNGVVFVQTYPQNGRRLIAVDMASGQVLDLSQEHWDAYYALSPNGTLLLMNNGRGDFWVADVVRE